MHGALWAGVRRQVVVFLVLVAALVLGSMPAQAIINGEEDGQEHPNVGGIIVHFGDTDETVLICSGSLVAPDLFLTAGHCNPGEFPAEWQTTLLGVTFDSAFDPETSNIVPATQFIAHPDFDLDAWPYTPDIAVIRLAKAATDFYPGIAPVELPEAGLIDAILREPAFRQELLTQVGYGQVGVTHGGGRPQQIYPDIRKYASTWLRLAPKSTGLNADYLFHTSHPGGQGGSGGGGCYGDSGGALFLGDVASNLQVGVHSGGWHVGLDLNLCRSSSFDVRLDTVIPREFLCTQGVSAACGTAVTAETAQTPKATKGEKGKGAKAATKGKSGKKHQREKHKAGRR